MTTRTDPQGRTWYQITDGRWCRRFNDVFTECYEAGLMGKTSDGQLLCHLNHLKPCASYTCPRRLKEGLNA